MNQFDVRQMHASDVESLADIERRSYDCPWVDEDFRFCLTAPRYCNLVCDDDGDVVGYAIAEVTDNAILLLRLCVDPTRRCEGFATAMLAKFRMCLTPYHRSRLTVAVMESNYEGRRYLVNQGFEETGAIHNYLQFGGVDAVVYSLRPFAKSLTRDQLKLKNRITKYINRDV